MAAEVEKYINYGAFAQRASELKQKNEELKNLLMDIKDLINKTSSYYESNSGDEIRSKINGMVPRFESYYSVIENYEKFIRNTAARWEQVENAKYHEANAEFI